MATFINFWTDFCKKSQEKGFTSQKKRRICSTSTRLLAIRNIFINFFLLQHRALAEYLIDALYARTLPLLYRSFAFVPYIVVRKYRRFSFAARAIAERTAWKLYRSNAETATVWVLACACVCVWIGKKWNGERRGEKNSRRVRSALFARVCVCACFCLNILAGQYKCNNGRLYCTVSSNQLNWSERNNPVQCTIKSRRTLPTPGRAQAPHIYARYTAPYSCVHTYFIRIAYIRFERTHQHSGRGRKKLTRTPQMKSRSVARTTKPNE